jgi:hypothetical protein
VLVVILPVASYCHTSCCFLSFLLVLVVILPVASYCHTSCCFLPFPLSSPPPVNIYICVNT